MKAYSLYNKKIPPLDPSTAIYHVTIFVLLALLCVAVFMGMVYLSWYKGMQKRRYEIQGKFKAKETFLPCCGSEVELGHLM